jgi:hypothetical protein
MMMKDKVVICSALVIILTACILSAGCTSPQTQTSPQSNSSTITIPPQTLSSTTPQETLVTTLALTTSPTSINSTMATPINSEVTVALNSAVKKTVIGDLKPTPGDIFLVLNVTIKNNDKNNGFDYRDSSFTIYDKVNKDRRTAITSIVASKLNSPLPATGTIPPTSTQTGLIVFRVMDSSNSYKFSVVDARDTVLVSIDNIEVP